MGLHTGVYLPLRRERARRYIGHMSFGAVSLRLVLSFLLVLNGWAGSVAATAMTFAQPPLESHASSAVELGVSKHHGCHGHALADGDRHPGPSGQQQLPGGHDDCCDSGMCGCACAQLPSLAALNLQFAPPGGLHGRLDRTVRSSWASPALPHLIRPPIV